MTDSDPDQSWYDITLEEELEKERKSSLSPLANVSSSNNIFSNDLRRGFPVLSPLKEADRSLEMGEEMPIKEPISVKEEMLDGEEPVFRTPTKHRLGPRASLRHTKQQDTTSTTYDNLAASVSPSPSRRVKLETVDASPVSRNVHSRLGPRAASRHSTTPEQTGSKRYLARDSPLRDTDHKDKRHRVGTPTRNKETPTRDKLSRDKHVFTTPEPARNTRRNQRGKFKTPNSDSRIYAKKNQTNKEHLAGTGKDLFGGTRKRGNSECSKENEEPLKSLTEEQIAKREKQVMYGKVTDGYQNYKSIVPKNMRHIRDPATPQKDYPYSKRCWDGLVRSWRRKLHEWDEPSVALNLRGAYTKNNKDLKESGLVNKSGEVVMFTSSDTSEISDKTVEEEIIELNEEPVPPPADPIKWDIPNFIYPTDDDARSQDSEYSRLLGNKDDFPDESDESDQSYRLSQDSNLGVVLSQEDEMMECEDAGEMKVGNLGVQIANY